MSTPRGSKAATALGFLSNIDPNDSGDEENDALSDVSLDCSFQSESDSEPNSGDETERHMDEFIEAVVNCTLNQGFIGPQNNPRIDVTSKSETVWYELKNGEESSHRSKIKFEVEPGATRYALNKIDDSALSSFLLIICNSIISSIVECTNAECIRNDSVFRVNKSDILAFIAVQFCRGVFCRGQSIEMLWNSKYGLPIVASLMSRDKFKLISKFLRFDDKSTRPTRSSLDKFAPVRDVWTKFFENSKACYKPSRNLTIDEQLLPTKSRCPFTQYMPNKPDKFGIKSWVLSEVLTKYVLSGIPYLGADVEKSSNDLQGEHVVKKLLEPYFNKGYHATTDNFFTTYTVVHDLLKVKTTIIGQ